MADLPANNAPDAHDPAHPSDASTDSPALRRPLPRAARLSQLTPPTVPSPATTPPAAVEPSVLPDAAGAPAQVPPAGTESSIADLVDRVRAGDRFAARTVGAQPSPAETAPIAPTMPLTPSKPSSAPSGPTDRVARPAVQLVELVAAAASTPSLAVAAAQQAAAIAAARPQEPVVFKPIDDVMATRSVILSGIGIVLCFFPVLSLAGLLLGVFAQRRIRRSNGALTGAGSARWGILLGAIGLVLGATVDMVFLLRR